MTAKSDGTLPKCRQKAPLNSKKWRQKMPSFTKRRKSWRQKVPSNPKSGGKKCCHILKVTAKSAVISHCQGVQGLFPWPEAFWRWRHKCVSGRRPQVYEGKFKRIRHAILRASRYKEISHSILQSSHPTNKNNPADRQAHPTVFIQIKQAHPRHRM